MRNACKLAHVDVIMTSDNEVIMKYCYEYSTCYVGSTVPAEALYQ